MKSRVPNHFRLPLFLGLQLLICLRVCAAEQPTSNASTVPDDPHAHVAALALEPEEAHLWSAVIDPSGYAFFGTGTRPGRIIKVALGNGDEPPRRVASITLEAMENYLRCAVIDPAGGYAYFGTDSAPGFVIKVALGKGDEPPRRHAALQVNRGEGCFKTALLRLDTRTAYFASDFFGGGSEPQVVNVALGQGDEPPTRIKSSAFGGAVRIALLDPENLSAYFLTQDKQPSLMKTMAPAEGIAANFVGEVAPSPGIQLPTEGPYVGVIDPDHGHLYISGFHSNRSVLAKFELGMGSDLPRQLGGVQFEGNPRVPTGVIDPGRGRAWFGTNESPARVFEVGLGAGDSRPSILSKLTISENEARLQCSVVDPQGGYAYFGTDTRPGRIIKIPLDPK